MPAYHAAIEAFRAAYEAEHPDERAAFAAGLEAAEPFMADAAEEVRAKGIAPTPQVPAEPF